MRRPVLLGLVALPAVTACAALTDSPEASETAEISGVICTASANVSFIVTVVDAVSEENLAPEAAVWVRDGWFVESLPPRPHGVYSGVHERPGTYEVVVKHPDYMDWRESDVRVEEGECHVHTREMTVRLTPRP